MMFANRHADTNCDGGCRICKSASKKSISVLQRNTASCKLLTKFMIEYAFRECCHGAGLKKASGPSALKDLTGFLDTFA